MSSLLLPGTQGAVCSNRYYLNRCAVLQDSKRWWNSTELSLSMVMEGAGWFVFPVSFFSFSSVAEDEPKVSQLTLLLNHHLWVFLKVFHLFFFFQVSWQKTGLGSKVKVCNPRILPSLLQIPTASTAAFRSTSVDKGKHPQTQQSHVNYV